MSAASLTIPDEYRYERKFVINALTPQEVEAIIKITPAYFSEIFHERFVNTLYFDSFALKSYFERIEGALTSTKIRIRWYGELFGKIEKPALEIKIKEGPLGKKEVFPLKGFLLENNFGFKDIGNVFRESNIPDIMKTAILNLELSVITRFKRKYFQSYDRKFRLTIDSDIEYYQLRKENNTFLNTVSEPETQILEIKYDRAADDFADRIINRIPFRMSKNSKYINALERLNFW